MHAGAADRTYDSFQAWLDDDTLVWSWRDVTDALEGEERLGRAYEETAEMRATLQTALDATTDGFAVYAVERDHQGRLIELHNLHTNLAGAQSLGLDPEEVVGRTLHEVLPDVESSGLWARILESYATKAPQFHRVHAWGDDGEWISAWDNTIASVGEERITIIWRDVSREERALRQLARTRDEALHSATHDALTDLPNRVLLREHLQDALRNCPPGERVGLVFVDLDGFKAVNDVYGHAAGDAVLRATSARLARIVRHGDMAARLAGDEFVLVLSGLCPDWLPDHFFVRAMKQISEPVWVDGAVLRPAASMGLVMADPHTQELDVDQLIKAADAEMYRNKAARHAASRAGSPEPVGSPEPLR
jgi:diguanylate cyclase (GGDEF)-like protein